MNVIEKIEMMRERKGWSQAELEGKARLPRNRISAWVMRPNTEPKASHLWSLAHTLGVPLDWLCNPNAADEPPSVATEPLSEIEREILGLVRRMGYGEALGRLSGVHEPPAKEITLDNVPVDPPKPEPQRRRSRSR